MSLVDDLNRQHPEYQLRSGLWNQLNLLFRGGDDLKRSADNFLLRRPKEPSDIYAIRSSRFFPQNILGTVISWYVSALWKKEISIDRDATPPPAEDKPDFYSQFLENCDMNNQKFTDFWSSRIESALIYKRSFVLVDLPQIDIETTNRKSQLEVGKLNAYLVPYEPVDVINWRTDRFGNLEWAVIKTHDQIQDFLNAPVAITRWWYFDKQTYRLFESRTNADATPGDDDHAVELPGGRHAMADQNRVPLFVLELQDAHWLGNRMYLQALDHLNQDNSYAWALFMANLPVPIFKTSKDMSGAAFSEATAIILEPGDDFSFNEPSGVSFEHSAGRVEQLREEIYRTCYLISQGRSSKATPAAQSGYSKELDMMPSKDVLNAIGRKIRSSMSEVLQAVTQIRGDSVTFDIRGFNYEESDAVAELAMVEMLQETDYPSDTVRKYQLKRAGRAIMSDAPQDEIATAMSEVEASPTIDEQKQEQLAAVQLKLDQSLGKATTRIAGAVAA